MALTKIIGSGIGTVTDNVVITSDDPTITMTDSSGTNDIATLQSTSGALIITVRDGTSDGEIIFKGNTGSAVTEHARIANTGLMTVISEGNAVQTSVQQGLAKAWVNFTGVSTTAERDSFNISGLTDEATARTTVAIANDMANTNYTGSYFQSGSTGTAADSYNNQYAGAFSARTAGNCSVMSHGGSGAIDVANNDLLIFGDLA
jgi:hypothetical protein